MPDGIPIRPGLVPGCEEMFDLVTVVFFPSVAPAVDRILLRNKP